MKADLVLMRGDVYSPHKGVTSIAVYKDRIVKLGSEEEILPYIGPNTKVINLEGKAVLPGFIDAHIHLSYFGFSLEQLDLRGTKSIEELKRVVMERAKSAGKDEWIIGRGWDQELFAEGRYPSRWDLDEVAPDNPVFLKRVCGHVVVVNSKALEISGITKDTKDPPGGRIDRDERGEPTGILRENAIELVRSKIPLPTLNELKSALEKAIRKAVSTGITSVHFICSDMFPEELRALQLLRKEGKLLLRVYLIVPYAFLEKLREMGIMGGFGDSMLRIGGVKLFADGSLGGRTAALEEPYADKPTETGVLVHTPEELKKIIAEVHSSGLQAAVHAIGDRAIRVVLDAIEFAVGDSLGDHRHRIEHASVINPELLERMRDLRVVAVCQPHFIVTDFWAKERVGPERAKWVYALKSLKENLVVAGSSDCPVEPVDPLRGIWAAVTRPFLPKEERLSVEEAIDIYTKGGAYASFEENEKGVIEEGKLADLVVLSDNPTKVDPDKIKDIEVEMTIVGGKVVYTRKPLPSIINKHQSRSRLGTPLSP